MNITGIELSNGVKINNWITTSNLARHLISQTNRSQASLCLELNITDDTTLKADDLRQTGSPDYRLYRDARPKNIAQTPSSPPSEKAIKEHLDQQLALLSANDLMEMFNDPGPSIRKFNYEMERRQAENRF